MTQEPTMKAEQRHREAAAAISGVDISDGKRCVGGLDQIEIYRRSVRAFVKFDAERTARITEAETAFRAMRVLYRDAEARALAAEQTVAEAVEVLEPFAGTRTECALGITASNETQTRCDHCTDPKMLCYGYRGARTFLASLKEQPHG